MEKENEYRQTQDIATAQPFDLAKHSSIGVGGEAKIAFYPQSAAQLTALLRQFYEEKRAYYVVGNMTNILPSDRGTDKAIVCTKKLVGLKFGDKTFAYAGEQSGAFLRRCREAEKGGAEFLAGIPCTIGGALYMNAGAAGVYISEIVDSVLVVREGELQTLEKAECEYSYKKSLFMRNKDVIVGATLKLHDSKKQTIDENIRCFLQRRAHLPKGKSMGCIFKNPDGFAAGELIEKAGLKGLRLGGAFVSEEHGNFIINDGAAKADDIKRLIKIVQNAVFAQYGLQLKEEIQYLD